MCSQNEFTRPHELIIVEKLCNVFYSFINDNISMFFFDVKIIIYTKLNLAIWLQNLLSNN